MGADTPDGPTTPVEALPFFADADTCLNDLIPIRWPDGITCPRCNGKGHSSIAGRRIWRCTGCKKPFRVKVGTVREDRPLGLGKWLTAIWLMANAKNGLSSWEAHRALGVTQKCAWLLLHRIRLAMPSGTLGKRNGEAEVDETFVGGKARDMHTDERAGNIHSRGRRARLSSSACWGGGARCGRR